MDLEHLIPGTFRWELITFILAKTHSYFKNDQQDNHASNERQQSFFCTKTVQNEGNSPLKQDLTWIFFIFDMPVYDNDKRLSMYL